MKYGRDETTETYIGVSVSETSAVLAADRSTIESVTL